jgi:16S rRNA (cytosine1402-N4)-methyltransferase
MNDPSSGQPHKRRVRYKGTHPHTFEEKYKELNPEKYAADVEHVISRGDTPAGTHRSICLQEVIDILNPQPGDLAVDATVGYGGHTREILKRIAPGGRLYGLDVDPVELPKTEARLRKEGFTEDQFITIRSNFSALGDILSKRGIPGVDMILADLGVSSMQIDDPRRGFTYKREGPLDMRMNQQEGETVAQLLARLGEAEIAALLKANADEGNAAVIANALAYAQRKAELGTTRSLTKAIRHALTPLGLTDKDITQATRRTYQALRIAVNGELSSLETFLAAIPHCLNPGGRVVILTFHSGEDDRVVRSFEAGKAAGHYAQIQNTEIRGSAEERYSNPRSRSVRVRWAIAP